MIFRFPLRFLLIFLIFRGFFAVYFRAVQVAVMAGS